jgi:hypothetical protein
MSYKSRDGKVHTTSILIGESGLPVDSIATISGSYIFIELPLAITYTVLNATVTLPVGADLTDLTLAKARYTGKYILLTNDNRIYYIDRQSIDIPTRTFKISISDKASTAPLSIDLTVGWKVAEADIINRLATTSAAKIDSVEFRDMHFQMELDGDPVSVRGENGNTLEPNPDGSINVNIINSTSPIPELSRNISNEVSAVASEATVTLVTYTVAPEKTAILERIHVSGGNIAKYVVYLNGNFFDSGRTGFTNLNINLEYASIQKGFSLSSGDTVSVTVYNYRPSPSDFTGRIQIIELG